MNIEQSQISAIKGKISEAISDPNVSSQLLGEILDILKVEPLATAQSQLAARSINPAMRAYCQKVGTNLQAYAEQWVSKYGDEKFTK